MKPGPELSVVVPAFNEEDNVRPMVQRCLAALDGVVSDFELVFVDDGSADHTWAEITALARANERVRGIRFSRNFGHQCAVTAGVDHCRGEAVVLIDGDLQDPPEVIPDLVARWRSGAEVVYARRSSREGETWLKKVLASGFYRILQRITDVPIPVDTGDFRLMGPRAVAALKALPEHNRFIRGLTSWIGFEQVEVTYLRQARQHGTTKYPLKAQLRFALDAITGFSKVPLRLPFHAGIGVLVAGALITLVSAVALALGISLPGGAWLMGGALMVVTGIQLLVLALFGQYLGRIGDEVRGRPLYLIGETTEDPIRD